MFQKTFYFKIFNKEMNKKVLNNHSGLFVLIREDYDKSVFRGDETSFGNFCYLNGE